MIRIAALGLLLAVSPLMTTSVAAKVSSDAEPDVRSGTWTASASDRRPGMLDVSLERGRHNSTGVQIERSELRGLQESEVASVPRVPVRFERVADAGTITFEGAFEDGHGAGTFRFAPNGGYLSGLRAMGVDVGTKREDDEMLTLAVLDVSAAFIRSMREVGFDVPLEKYVEFRIFQIGPPYVREMALAGLPHLSAERLVETRIQGVTPQYIHDLGVLGYVNLPAEKLVEMRIQGVTPEFIRQVEAAGYRRVPVDKLIQMKIFGVDPKMVRALDDGRDGGRAKSSSGD
jgi:hypothetical protein